MTTLLEQPLASVPSLSPVRHFRIRRHRRGDTDGHWEGFEAPAPSARTTVLDALVWLRAQRDPSLDVRHSCFHASCGTCGMRVNGREVLACVTRIADLPGDEIVVEPLRNQPVVSDLVVDLEALYEALDEVGLPLVRGSACVPGAEPAAGVDHLTRFEDCIECGLCVSACPIEATDPDYAGPAMLGAAWRLTAEPRGLPTEPAYALVDGEQGAWRCHLTFECNEACPTGALPGEEIAHLRRGLLQHRVARWLHHRASEEVPA